jgi:hypothetical protein
VNRPALTSDLHSLADDLYGADPALDQLVNAVIALHHTEHDDIDLSAISSRLVGESSVLGLLALVLEAKADSKAVQNLPTRRRHATKAALHAAAAALTDLAHTAHGDNAAWHLDPA